MVMAGFSVAFALFKFVTVKTAAINANNKNTFFIIIIH
jgi:hypothetical protein